MLVLTHSFAHPCSVQMLARGQHTALWPAVLFQEPALGFNHSGLSSGWHPGTGATLTRGLTPVTATQTPPCPTPTYRVDSPSSRKSVRKGFSKKTGQTALIRTEAWPDKCTRNQPFYSIIPLSFPHLFLPKSSKSLPFLTFAFSPKHPIINPVQSQNPFALHPIMCSIPLGRNLPQFKRCSRVDSW